MNSGSRPQVMPRQRIVWTVTRMFSPVRIELKPVMKMPTIVRMTFVLLNADE